MTPSETFLPKDRDDALLAIKELLYARAKLLDYTIEELHQDDPGDGFVVGKLIAYKNQRMFLSLVLDIIERS